MKSKLRIIVTGLAGLYPVGGVAWDYLQYVIGLARLGHDVYYHEDTWSWPYHPLKKEITADGAYSAKFIANFFVRHAPELNDRWHYRHLHSSSYGMADTAFDQVAQTADLFLNVSGASAIPKNLSSHCIKIFLDTDPGYNQILLKEQFAWSENIERWCETVAAHDQHFTYAENIHEEDCLVPKLNFDWKTTRMPMVLDLWSPLSSNLSERAPWTTVMTWNAFKGKLMYQGVEYKSKGAEFDKFINLPQKISLPLKVAVGGVNAPLDKLSRSGWDVVDGPGATLSPGNYQDFIQASKGEFSTAKQVYVAMRTGWFSCRSACYLASGRPVVVQDTGFSKHLPCGDGLLSFNTLQAAAAGLKEAEANYLHHAKKAKEMAREYFDSNRVLTRLIEDAMRCRV